MEDCNGNHYYHFRLIIPKGTSMFHRSPISGRNTLNAIRRPHPGGNEQIKFHSFNPRFMFHHFLNPNGLHQIWFYLHIHILHSHSLAQLGENRRWESLDNSRQHTGNRLHSTTKLLQFKSVLKYLSLFRNPPHSSFTFLQVQSLLL